MCGTVREKTSESIGRKAGLVGQPSIGQCFLETTTLHSFRSLLASGAAFPCLIQIFTKTHDLDRSVMVCVGDMNLPHCILHDGGIGILVGFVALALSFFRHAGFNVSHPWPSRAAIGG